jgi:general secretion pathway protein G
MNSYTINNQKSKLSLSLSLSNRLKKYFGYHSNLNYRKNSVASANFINSPNSPAFTIVELLVVIVIIGILAAITIVAYTGVTSRATSAALQSDLTNASQQLKMYQATYGSYPTTMVSNCPTLPTPDNTLCLKSSSGNTLSYSSNTTGTTFALTNTNSNGTAYGINDTSSPVALAQPTSCPTGFIPVPGSATYGQAGFCVMKYAASQVGSTTTPISQASGTPWVNISQTTAIANSPNVAGCTGCHLITEAEYMTIAQNVLSVASNWSGASVGSGYIPRGNSNSSAAMDGTTDLTGVNKRTLTLTNGQIIWDLAGNVWEWTSGVTNGTTAQEPGKSGNGWSWLEWTQITANGSLAINPSPAGTGLSGASTWNSNNDVGQIYSNSDDTGLYGFIRGGNWSYGGNAGVLALNLSIGPSSAGSPVGFRVSR